MYCADDAKTAIPPVDVKDNFGRWIGEVELRYSPTCRTVWARVTNKVSDAGNGWDYRNPWGTGFWDCGISKWSSTVNGYSCYTPMLYDAGQTSYARGQFWDPYEKTWLYGETGNY